MSVPAARRNISQLGQPDFNTLDEPIKETIVWTAWIYHNFFKSIIVLKFTFKYVSFVFSYAI